MAGTVRDMRPSGRRYSPRS